MTGFLCIVLYYNRVYSNSNSEYLYRIAPHYIRTVIK